MVGVDTGSTRPPDRFERPDALAFIAYLLLLAFVLWSFNGVGWSVSSLA
jgi:phosphonate transport system permease protein